MAILLVLGVAALVAGLLAIGLSAPTRVWEAAMLRLGERLQTEAITQGRHQVGTPADGADPHAPGPAPPAVRSSRTAAPPASGLIDRMIDSVIEGLRRLIGTRGFPRTALRILGAVLILVAVVCLLLGTLVGKSQSSEEDGARPQEVPAALRT